MAGIRDSLRSRPVALTLLAGLMLYGGYSAAFFYLREFGTALGMENSGMFFSIATATMMVLEGRIDGAPARLWWLPGERLPALLEHGRGGTLVRLRLRELHAVPPASWPGMTETRLSGFGTIDAADFGDMEYDPFVRKVMRQDGHVHAHGH